MSSLVNIELKVVVSYRDLLWVCRHTNSLLVSKGRGVGYLFLSFAIFQTKLLTYEDYVCHQCALLGLSNLGVGLEYFA